MIKTDCIYFPLDMPCKFHKENGTKCSDCWNYSSVNSNPKDVKKILIVKLGAMGDVIRTTFILEGLKEKYPESKITWIVAKESVDILKANPLIDAVWQMDDDIFLRLSSEKFSFSINLDLSPASLAICGISLSDNKVGYYLDNKRKIRYSNSFAKQWLLMSAFDDVKKKNKKTYQYWMSKIAGLPKNNYEIYTPLLKESVDKAKQFALKHKLKGKTVTGINPGAGKRWHLKKWTDQGYVELIKKLVDSKAEVLLFGGQGEKELLSYLIKMSGGRAISTGTDNSIPDFFALLNLCDLVVCGDTLALHAALGLKKKVAAIFGPTSSAEIEMYGRGIKVVSPADCVCCYKQTCEVKPNCMEMISPNKVWTAIKKLLSKEQRTKN